MSKPNLAILPPPASKPERLPPINWERVRGTLTPRDAGDRPERSPQEVERDRRAASELRRLARDLPGLDPTEVQAKLGAIGAWYEGAGA